MRENQLVGYGLVVGLNGTGDKLDNAVFTRQSLIGMLERLGVNTRDQETKLRHQERRGGDGHRRTARLRAQRQPDRRRRVGARRRDQPDRRHAAGDAAAGGRRRGLRASRKGALATGAIAARGAASSVTRGVPTAGRIANGATVEREVHFRLDKRNGHAARLRNPDLTTARRIAAAINQALGAGSRARPIRARSRSSWHGRDPVDALARIEDLRVEPDSAAIVVIDEASGTDRHGGQCADQHRRDRAGQSHDKGDGDARRSASPARCRTAVTVVVPRTEVQVDDQHDRKLGILRGSVTLRDLVASLNALGVGPRDLISILQSIKAAGALQADLQVR